MAKKSSGEIVADDYDNPYSKWRVESAVDTMMRAGEIVKDKKMIALVRKAAGERAKEMAEVSKQAAQLAKMGRISPKAAAKHLAGMGSGAKSLEKTAPIAAR